jgi:hypothetical protein
MTDAEQIAAVLAEALRTSRLAWGTHSDRWTDEKWQAEFWAEAGQIAAAALLPLLDTAAREAAAKAWREGAAAGHHSPLTWFALRQVNPYREGADR